MKNIISKSILLTIIVIFINFTFKIYLSYNIEKENLGLFYTSVDLISVASLLFSGYKDSMIKVFADNNFKFVNNYIFKQYLIMVIVLIPVIYLIFKNYHNIDRLYPVYLFILFFIITQISNYYSYLNVSHRKYNSMLYEKSVKAISLVISFFILSFYFKPMIALILSYIVQLSSHIVYIFITSSDLYFNKGEKNDKTVYRYFLKNYKIATITSFFGSITIYLSAVIMFYLYADSTILAEYQIVVKSIFFALVAVFVHPVTAYTFPEISKYISNKELFEVKRLDTKLQLYLALFLLILLSSTVITKYLISLIFPSEYIESYKMLNILLPFLPFIIYTSFCINIIKAFNRFDLALYIRIIGSTVFFIAIYIFYILKFDAKSIVYSLSISFFVMFLLSLYYKKRLLK